MTDKRRTKTYYVYYGYFGEFLLSDLPVEGLMLYKTIKKAIETTEINGNANN